MTQIIVMDTSVLCVFLGVPEMESCGPDFDKWTPARVAERWSRLKKKATFVLPLATIIETGNHIAQARHSRRECGQALGELMIKCADEKSPWAAFSRQAELWSPENLKILAGHWPELAMGRISIGDATIKDVAELYAASGFHVEIWTGDAGLKAYEPSKPVKIPRRRR